MSTLFTLFILFIGRTVYDCKAVSFGKQHLTWGEGVVWTGLASGEHRCEETPPEQIKKRVKKPNVTPVCDQVAGSTAQGIYW